MNDSTGTVVLLILVLTVLAGGVFWFYNMRNDSGSAQLEVTLPVGGGADSN